ncbi:hypothetical protein [Sinorhizobium fredii]|uniref:hypothetical protein n=1 Tax=Rhizobium fredii TaxID=380 RepID=UPI003395FBAC
MQLARDMTLEAIRLMSDDPLINLPAVARANQPSTSESAATDELRRYTNSRDTP